MTLRALALNCTLKSGTEESSTELMCRRILDALAEHDVQGTQVRVVDRDVKPGVTSDEGDGDEWPALRRQILEAQIFILGTPVWLGNPSSICRRVLERLDALLGETDHAGRPIASGRVAVVGTVGNEDGAHNVAAQLYQGLADIGFTIPAGAQAYWVGEAMGSVDYKDLDDQPDKVAETTATLARNAAHLAQLLQERPYPAPPSGEG